MQPGCGWGCAWLPSAFSGTSPAELSKTTLHISSFTVTPVDASGDIPVHCSSQTFTFQLLDVDLGPPGSCPRTSHWKPLSPSPNAESKADVTFPAWKKGWCKQWLVLVAQGDMETVGSLSEW